MFGFGMSTCFFCERRVPKKTVFRGQDPNEVTICVDGMDSSRDLNGITCESRLASKRALGRRSCDE